MKQRKVWKSSVEQQIESEMSLTTALKSKGQRVEPEEHQSARCLNAKDNTPKSEMNCACR